MSQSLAPAKGTSFSLQDAVTISYGGGGAGAVTQPLQEAVDIGPFDTVVIQVHRLSQKNDATLHLQTSNVLVESAFENCGAEVVFDATGSKSIVLTTHGRYVRWRLDFGSAGSVTFSLPGLGR
jgi:hypothetical protein